MDFISQYLSACAGTVVPKRYTMWSALSILGMTLGRKVFLDEKHFMVYPGIHICLVGDPASKKSTAKDQARDMFTSCFPDYPTGVSVTSREDIVKFLSSDECRRTFTDKDGNLMEWRPLANFVNELSNFMSFSPKSMIEFLTDVYDAKFFVSSTIKRGREEILHPHVLILACTVPDYIITTFKSSVIGGGFSRRILFVYETEMPPKLTFPHKPPEAYVSEAWCKAHLQKVWSLTGEFQWEPDARAELNSWFLSFPTIRDNVLAGYYNSKDIVCRKVAMCLAAAEEDPKLLLTKDLIQKAIAFLDSIDANLPKLTVAAGRNELAVYSNRLLQILADKEGWMLEKVWHKFAAADLSEFEYFNTKKMLCDTTQIFEFTSKNNKYIVLPSAAKDFLAKHPVEGIC